LIPGRLATIAKLCAFKDEDLGFSFGIIYRHQARHGIRSVGRSGPELSLSILLCEMKNPPYHIMAGGFN
jgi:hypothetical protein